MVKVLSIVFLAIAVYLIVENHMLRVQAIGYLPWYMEVLMIGFAVLWTVYRNVKREV